MTFQFLKWVKGINIKPVTSSSAASKGDLEVLNSDGKLYYHNGSTLSAISTEGQSGTITNKIIDASVNTITNITDVNIKTGASINAAKIASGDVSNTIFEFLKNVTSDIQTQLNNGTQGITDLTGDVTGTGPGSTPTTIANDAVTNAKAANMANGTIKGRTTAGTGNPEDLTTSQVNTLLGTITSLTGDVTASGPGAVAATIPNNTITNAKAAQMPAHTFKGNNTGVTANPSDLTQSQLTAELNPFTSSLQGVVPLSGGGATKFLNADASFVSLIFRSQVSLSGAAANGTTNTTVARFTTTNKNVGTDITYVDSVANGASFTVNTDGIYSASFVSAGAATGRNMALTVNGTTLSSDPATPITYAQGLRAFGGGSTGGNVSVPVNWTGILSSGDVVRAQISSSGNNSELTIFNIVKVGG